MTALLTTAIVAVLMLTSSISATQNQQQQTEHLVRIVESLADTSFPLTQDIVDRIAEMSGGRIISADDDGAVRAASHVVPDDIARQLKQFAMETPGSDAPHKVVVWDGRSFLTAVISRQFDRRTQRLFVLVPQQTFAHLWWQSMRSSLPVALATLLLALGISIVLSHRVGQRVESVRQLFSRLASGDFPKVDPSGANDEITDLMVSANELSTQLRDMQDELRRTERLELMGQLSGGLAHQLRNSITGARMAVQLHQQNCGSIEDDSMLDAALSQLRLTEEQIQAVLSLQSSPERSESTVDTNLSELVQDVVTLVSPRIAHWKTDFAVSVDDDMHCSLRQPSAVRGAILNLLINAIEAAGVAGRVSLSLSQSTSDGESSPTRPEDTVASSTGSTASGTKPPLSRTVCLEIEDSGPGFMGDWETASRPFVTGKPQGIGIGLTIAQHAIDAEDGRLNFARRTHPSDTNSHTTTVCTVEFRSR
ncbi:MAG: hypothetical protein KDA81_08425 [Planctomycetaceae bacterium]|nr:hypothetical protein [Planctomycetaceae bacterium]